MDDYENPKPLSTPEIIAGIVIVIVIIGGVGSLVWWLLWELAKHAPPFIPSIR